MEPGNAAERRAKMLHPKTCCFFAYLLLCSLPPVFSQAAPPPPPRPWRASPLL